MTHTKNMIYKPSAEADKLYIFAKNEYKIYKQIEAIDESLKKKITKGIYDAGKAVDAFYYAMTTASDLYNKMFGYSFSVTERWTAATELADDFTLENA